MKKMFQLSKLRLLTVFLLLLLSTLAIWFYTTQKPSNVIIGVNSWTGYDPFILADEKGFFKKNNVQVTVQQFASTGDEIKAFKEGEIEGVGLTLGEAFSLIGAGYSGKIVLVVDVSQGGDMVIGQAGIHSISDLIGKRVGYEGTVVGEFLLQRALQSQHIKNKDVQLINVAAENWLERFKNKDIELGCDDNFVGENKLGNILMKIKEDLLLKRYLNDC